MTGTVSDKEAHLPTGSVRSEGGFRSLVRRAQAVVLTERVVPKVIVPVACTGGLFVSSVWTGMWSYIPHAVGRPGLLAAFALAAAVSPLLVKGRLWTSKADGVKRLDDNLGEVSEPARMINSSYSYAKTPEEKTWYEMSRTELLKKWGDKFTIGYPKINIQKSWRIAAAGIAALTFATGIYAGPERGNYMREAFNVHAPVIPVPPPTIHAWLSPPKGIKQKTQYWSNQDEKVGSEWTTHQESLLKLRTSGTPTKVRLNGKEIEFEILIGEDGQKTNQYSPVQLTAGEHVLSFTNGPTWVINVPPDHAPQLTIKGVGENLDQPGSLSFACDAKDDHGVIRGEVEMALPDTPENSQALPSAKLPKISVPGNQFCNK